MVTKKQTVFITGANSGFGLLITVELAKRGYNVIASMRDLKNKDTIIELCKLNDVDNQITFIQLDVTNKDHIDNLKKKLKKLPPIDILINNAGFALGGFSEEVSIEEYKEQFDTNFFGVISVTQAILPIMRARQQGKIMNLSSISGRIGFPGLSPYVSSKYALEGWSESLRLEVKPFGIDVALIEPGSYQTNIWTKGKKIAEKSLDHRSAYSAYLKSILKHMEEGKNSYGNPLDVAILIAKLCSRNRLRKLRYPVGKGIKVLLFFKTFVPWRLWEKLFFKKLGQ